MDEYITPLLMMGLSKRQMAVVLVLLKAINEIDAKKGMVTLEMMRAFTGLDGGVVRGVLERLRAVGILIPADDDEDEVRVVTPSGMCVFNTRWDLWRLSETSPGVKMASQLGVGADLAVLVEEVNCTNFKQALKTRNSGSKASAITAETLLDDYIMEYALFYGYPYSPSSRAKDIRLLQKVLVQFVSGGHKKEEAREFIKWCFRDKAPEWRERADARVICVRNMKSLADEFLAKGLARKHVASRKFRIDENGEAWFRDAYPGQEEG